MPDEIDARGEGMVLKGSLLRAIRKYGDELQGVVLRAWDRYRQLLPQFRGPPDARSRGAIMSCFLWEEMERAFLGQPGLRLTSHRGRRLMVLPAGDAILQVKKLRKNGKPWNYPTPTAMAFDLQMPIQGMAPGIRVTVGYTINALGTEIEAVDLLVMDGLEVLDRAPLLAPTTEPLKFATPRVATKKRRLGAKKKKPSEGGSGAGQ